MGNAIVDTLILKKYINVKDGYEFLVTPSPEGILTIVITASIGFMVVQEELN